VVRTSPAPKNFSHARFTHTRAVSGWSGAVSHRASPSRSGLAPGGSGGRAAGSPAATFAPFLSYCPRRSTKASRGGPSFITITVGRLDSYSAAAFRAAAAAASARFTGPSADSR
jgi:hypothetical protein